ncbi:MAG: potassium-transporting ATPase subunit KdpC [Alphaproteobacteria bacterium]
MIKELRPTITLVLLMTALTGLAYPLTITGVAQLLFPYQANGSLIERDGKIIGSELIGQNFTRPEYFHPRPSAVNYDASNSGGSNLAPSSTALVEAIKQRAEKLRSDLSALDETNTKLAKPKVPVELVTQSGSGLDPHISFYAAEFQLKRIAKVRELEPGDISKLIVNPNTEDRTFGLLGEQRVNVLKLNLALDALRKDNAAPR